MTADMSKLFKVKFLMPRLNIFWIQKLLHLYELSPIWFSKKTSTDHLFRLNQIWKLHPKLQTLSLWPILKKYCRVFCFFVIPNMKIIFCVCFRHFPWQFKLVCLLLWFSAVWTHRLSVKFSIYYSGRSVWRDSSNQRFCGCPVCSPRQRAREELLLRLLRSWQLCVVSFVFLIQDRF